VDKTTIVNAIKNGASSIKKLQAATNAGVGGRCLELNPRGRCCHPDIAELLKIYGE
jgi:NAD(P)H-nitrite reductase large subunit